MSQFGRFILPLLTLGMFLSACDGKLPSTEPGSATAEPKSPAAEEILWSQGSVEEAFSRAKTHNKPLYLYWGAVWCPPCEEINQTVFKDPSFIAQSRLFVPVYLDGDTGRAQTWGEHFAVQGYPTMIIFNPEGEELTRIPGAIDVELYNDVLQLSLNGMRKIPDLLASALDSPAQLSAEDFTQLAYYAWSQENLAVDIDSALLRTLANRAEEAGNQLAASRLYLESLAMAHSRDQQLSQEDKAEARQRLESILSDTRLTLANFDFSMFWSKELISLISEPGETRVRLSELWADQMQSLRQHSSLSKAEQLGSWYPQLHLYWLNNPEAETLPEQTLQAVREHVAEMDHNTQGAARQTVINKAYQVLQAAHLYEESRVMLLAEIDKSDSPYYFMSGLASLAEQQNDFATASDWLERAYHSAEGKATRFQWGVEYVTGLIRMQPDRVDRISDGISGLLDNLEQTEDVFSGRNFGRLQTLHTALQDWQVSAEQQPAIAGLYSRLASACDTVDRESIAYQNCSSLEL